MEAFLGHNILSPGATSGIGALYCWGLCKHGDNVLISGRRALSFWAVQARLI